MKKITIALLCIVFSLPLICQHGGGGGNQVQGRLYRQLRTIDRLKVQIGSQHHNVAQERRLIEQQIAQSIKSGLEIPEETLIIPVIFHILTNPYQQVPITEEMVFEQLQILNQCFSEAPEYMDHEAMYAEDFVSRMATPNIQFCLARQNPTDSYRESIKFYNDPIGGWTINDNIKYAQLGGVDPVDTDKYINIWVASLDESVSGYAQMPIGNTEEEGGGGNGNAHTFESLLGRDGIVIDYKFFGIQADHASVYDANTYRYVLKENPYNRGKTLVHLLGNYFNLYPLWGMGGCTDDAVHDTPVHNAPNYGCPVYRHVTTCFGASTIEMSMNLMDNTDDQCMTFFTNGQISRIYANLLPGGAREGIVNDNYQCTGTGYANTPIVGRAEKDIEDSSIKLYPNPSQGRIYIDISGYDEMIKGNITAYDASGKLMYTQVVDGQRIIEIDATTWLDGLYLLVLEHKSKIIYANSITIINK